MPRYSGAARAAAARPGGPPDRPGRIANRRRMHQLERAPAPHAKDAFAHGHSISLLHACCLCTTVHLARNIVDDNPCYQGSFLHLYQVTVAGTISAIDGARPDSPALASHS